MSKKTLDITGIKNELEGASLHFRRPVAVREHAEKPHEPAPQPTPAPQKRAARPRRQSTPPAEKTNAEVRPVDRPVDQLTGRAVERPVSFYIPEVINAKIDEAVDYIDKRHGIRVDRSAVVSAILGSQAVWEPEALNQLVDQAVGQLTSRLTNRLTNRPTTQLTSRPTSRPTTQPGSSSNGNPSTEVEMRSVP